MSTIEIILAAALVLETGLGVWLYTVNVKLSKEITRLTEIVKKQSNTQQKKPRYGGSGVPEDAEQKAQ